MTMKGDANPCHGQEVNYDNANFYKSLDSETFQLPLQLKGGNQKEKLIDVTLPQKVNRVINSCASEAKKYQFP